MEPGSQVANNKGKEHPELGQVRSSHSSDGSAVTYTQITDKAVSYTIDVCIWWHREWHATNHTIEVKKFLGRHDYPQ